MRDFGSFRLFQNLPNLKLNKPQLNITVDREKASSLGVSVRDVARTMQVLLGGLNLSTFRFNNKRYDVMVQAERDARLQDLAASGEELSVEGAEGVGCWRRSRSKST